MFTDNEIKRLFYVLDARFFHSGGRSSIFLEYPDHGYELWFSLVSEKPQWVYYTAPFHDNDNDRDNFCELLFHLYNDACETKPWLVDWAHHA